MIILWYPTPKQSPLLGSLGLGGGIGANVIRSAAGGGTVDTSAAHFWDFSSNNSSPFDDQVGSLSFTVNTSSMATGSSTGSYGNPPGWSGGYGYIANSGSYVQTAANACFNLSGNFCIDCCFYNPNGTSNSFMAWSQGKSSTEAWYIYNSGGNSRWNSANSDYSGRLGGDAEGGSDSDPKHNYVEDAWCVSRLRRSGDTVHVKFYKANSGNTGWDQAPGSPYSNSCTGTGPDGASNGGFLVLNGWTLSGTNGNAYSVNNLAIAWMAYYSNGSKTDDPFVPS